MQRKAKLERVKERKKGKCKEEHSWKERKKVKLERAKLKRAKLVRTKENKAVESDEKQNWVEYCRAMLDRVKKSKA